MTSAQSGGSDGIRGEEGMDISELAREFDIDPDVLEIALEGTKGVLGVSRENIRPADRKALRGVAKTLEATIDRLSADAVRERLMVAAIEWPAHSEDDELANYTAWWAARDRVAKAIEGARDLLALARAGEAFKGAAGRPQYDHWTFAINSLLEFWTDHLGRKVTVSGHRSDPRGVKASPTLRFVHQCMLLLGEDLTEEACRTILQRLRKEGAVPPVLP